MKEPTKLVANFEKIEIKSKGRIGVSAINLANNTSVSYRDDERFAILSTFKWILGALILNKVELGIETLSRRVTFNKTDLVTYSPVTKHKVGHEGMTLGELCEATIQTSDNTAANLLINILGGPQEVTKELRKHGDTKTRLDRLEPFLNAHAIGDPRDSTTPNAMCHLMQYFIFGNGLSEASKSILREWMIGAQTGRNRLRAGIPVDWVVGNKTGTATNNANNDVAFAIPPVIKGNNSHPILITSYTNTPDPFSAKSNAIHVDIAKEALRALL